MSGIVVTLRVGHPDAPAICEPANTMTPTVEWTTTEIRVTVPVVFSPAVDLPGERPIYLSAWRGPARIGSFPVNIPDGKCALRSTDVTWYLQYDKISVVGP